MNYFHHDQPFDLEGGAHLPDLTIAYHTYGKLNEGKSNVVWVCHALTANSDVADWWPGVVGKDFVIDPQKYFIVCANILGSCYGTTGPLSTDPEKKQAYYDRFPLITIRDMVRAHQLLAKYLSINSIHLLIGGSMGGYQALEWCAMDPGFIENLFLIATSARETAWGIAIHTAQRLAIEADQTWKSPGPDAATNGLKAARAIAMLTYRNYETYLRTQTDPDPDKLDHFKASGYIMHQGNKLIRRFNAYSYWTLSKSMDSHNLARGRSTDPVEVLRSLRQRTLVIGISNDLLCPLQETRLLADHIPGARFEVIDSLYGHDGFLTEHGQISYILRQWLPERFSTFS